MSTTDAQHRRQVSRWLAWIMGGIVILVSAGIWWDARPPIPERWREAPRPGAPAAGAGQIRRHLIQKLDRGDRLMVRHQIQALESNDQELIARVRAAYERQHPPMEPCTLAAGYPCTIRTRLRPGSTPDSVIFIADGPTPDAWRWERVER